MQRGNDALTIIEGILYCLFLSATFGDVSKYQDNSGNFSVRIANGRRAIVNGPFRLIFCDEERVVCESDDQALSQSSCSRVFDGRACVFVHNLEDYVERCAERFLLRPAR